MAEISWIKLRTDMFDDNKIKIIQNMPDGDALLVIWIRLITLAGSTNADGYVYLGEDLPYTEDMLAIIFNKPISTVRLALSTLEKLQMIELDTKGIFLVNFSKHQNLEKMMEIREYNRQKKQESRERKRQLLVNDNVKDNALTVNQNVNLDKDKEEDKEEDKEVEEDKKEKEKESKNTKKETVKSIFEYYTGGELLNVLMDFAEMRKSTNAKLTPRAAQMICNKLDTLADNDIDKIKIVENSIMNSWKGIFALKQDSNTGSSYKQQPTTQDLLQSEGVQAFLRGE